MTYPLKILSAWNLRPQKRLSQNFLTDPSFAENIIKKAEINQNDTILEIGAGIGALTVPAAFLAKKVYAVEKDSRLITLLKTECLTDNISNVEVINEDILNLNLKDIVKSSSIIVIGNLPYNISSQIIVKLINERDIIRKAIVTLQKEMAQRLLAKPCCKDYGRLTVMLNYCSSVSKLADIDPHLFYPKPKVSSSVINITFNKKKEGLIQSEKSFLKLEKECENYVKGFLKAAQYIASGPQPVIAYFLMKEAEIRTVRMMLVGKKNSLDAKLLLDRLGDWIG